MGIYSIILFIMYSNSRYAKRKALEFTLAVVNKADEWLSCHLILMKIFRPKVKIPQFHTWLYRRCGS
jgi:hypothetical protein